MKLSLKIFVVADCPSCAETQTIATDIQQNYPELAIEVIDIADTEAMIPDAVFATPTFMLNNRIVSLGNPKPDEVAQWVKEAAVVNNQ